MPEIIQTTTVCSHSIEVRFWGECEVTDELKESLLDAGEARAQELLNQNYHSGELNYEDDENDTSLRGWWKIL